MGYMGNKGVSKMNGWLGVGDPISRFGQHSSRYVAGDPDLYHQYSRYFSDRLGRLYLHNLQCTLALRPMAELSSTVMCSAESRSQHEVEREYCSQCHDHCHALGGKCPAFSSYSFAALMLHDVVIEPL